MLADRERKTSGPPREAGRIIRAWRRRIGLTQEGLAQALSVTFSTVLPAAHGGEGDAQGLCQPLLGEPDAPAPGAERRFDRRAACGRGEPCGGAVEEPTTSARAT